MLNRRRGFSLVEMGIVIAVISVLVAVVIGGMGFANSAKKSKAVDQVLMIRKAAREYAMRHQNGLRYGASAAIAPGNVSLNNLQSENFLNGKVVTPWEDPRQSTGMVVRPNSTAAPVCAGFACVEIVMPVPTSECTDGDLVGSLQNQAVAVTCAGTTLTVVMR
jgi:prepilin-type N-terminal cleavage/methylation domain-containing protein